MIGATLAVWLSQGFTGGLLIKQAAILIYLLLVAISASLLLTVPGRISIELNVLKREDFQKVSVLFIITMVSHRRLSTV